VSGNLKVDTDSLPFDAAELKQLAKAVGNRHCWIAASTHEGEEEAVAKVHQHLKSKNSAILTVIVPRHPDRSAKITALLRGAGLTVAVRSQNQPITADTDIYLGDTIGEMGLYLNMGSVVFIGRSLVANGGQNPLEPAMSGIAIISGAQVHNFRESYKNLLEAGAVRLVADEQMLAANVEYLLSNPQEREKMVIAARKCVEEMRGALEETIKILDSYVFPLTVKRDLEGIG